MNPSIKRYLILFILNLCCVSAVMPAFAHGNIESEDDYKNREHRSARERPSAIYRHMTAKHIVLEAGHYVNGSTSGSGSCHDAPNKIYEGVNTKAVSELAATILRSYGHTVTVLDATRDNLVGLVADAFVSVHNDYCAPGVSGYQLARSDGKHTLLVIDGKPMTGIKENNDASDRLTISLWNRYETVTGIPRIHAISNNMTQYYAWSRIDAATPGSIIEMGFWSGDEDMLLNQRGVLAAGIAEGILGYLEQLDGDDVRTMEVPESHMGTISPANDLDSYYFDGTQGQTVSIEMDSENGSTINAYLSLYAPNGERINDADADNDRGTGTDAKTEQIVLPSNGRYRIIASSWNGESTGTYTIKLFDGTVSPLDKPVYGYIAPCQVGVKANVTTFHGLNKDGKLPVDLNRRSYDWRCHQDNSDIPGEVGTMAVHAPIGGQIVRIAATSVGGMILIDDLTNDACVTLLHLDSSQHKVSVGQTVNQGDEISTYPDGYAHVHMAATDGSCASNGNLYYHSKERPIFFKEFGEVLPPGITLYGTLEDPDNNWKSDGPKQWVVAGDCINPDDANCLLPKDGNGGGGNPNLPKSEYFDDVGHSIFAPYIDALKEAGITTGCSSADPTIFCPEDLLTRQTAVGFIVRSLQVTPPNYTSYSYPDIDGSGKFDNYIEYLTQLDIVNGYSDGTFKPNDPVDRGQIAKMLINALEKSGKYRYTCVPNESTAFPDVPAEHGFYRYIQCLWQLEITHGYSDGTFQPERKITRAEMSKFLYLTFLQELSGVEPALDGDLTGDNKVNLRDVIQIIDMYRAYTPPGPPDTTEFSMLEWTQADLYTDGTWNIRDVRAMIELYRATTP